MRRCSSAGSRGTPAAGGDLVQSLREGESYTRSKGAFTRTSILQCLNCFSFVNYNFLCPLSFFFCLSCTLYAY